MLGRTSTAGSHLDKVRVVAALRVGQVGLDAEVSPQGARKLGVCARAK